MIIILYYSDYTVWYSKYLWYILRSIKDTCLFNSDIVIITDTLILVKPLEYTKGIWNTLRGIKDTCLFNSDIVIITDTLILVKPLHATK